MRFGKWIGLSVLWLAIVACAAHFVAPPDALVLYAQTLPMTVHAIWNANPAPPPATQYSITLDGGSPVVMSASSCTSTCSQALTLAGFGTHQIVIVAQTQKITPSPDTSTWDSSPISLTFSLNAAPKPVTGATVTN